MHVDDALLNKLEKLSYLKISEDKREEVIAQLSEIVSFVDNLGELDTEGVEDKFAMSGEATYMREDEPSCDARINDSIIANAPKSDDHYFVVNKIIE